MSVRVALFCLVAAATGCTSLRGDRDSVTITPDELLAGAPLGAADLSGGLVVGEQGVLALSPEMQDFVDQHVDRKATGNVKLHQLVSAIMGTDTFGVEYDDVTRTASETFRARRGNCLSFSNMFVTMARSVGLDVQFQEVDVPPDWTRDNDTFVLNRHVNVYVDLGPSGRRIVDFNIGDFKSSYPMRRISDARALAHYHNNIGVERMQAGDTAAALSFFRRAIADNDRAFSPPWTNLGTLYQRSGQLSHAEAAYLQALDASGSDLVAMSNLTGLYERLGDRERAAAYHRRVIHHRMRNPYYRYGLARDALDAEDWGAAIDHLNYAIRRRPREDQFCFLLGLTYLHKGDELAARRWFARAQELAASDALKRGYSSKIDILLRRGGGGGGGS